MIKIHLPGGIRVEIEGTADARTVSAVLCTVMAKRDPHAGDVFVFRGRRSDLMKILWHDGLGFSL